MGSNERGVAILLVLSAVFVLSALAADFTFENSIQMRLAANARNRLQAEYLAQSAVNFLKLELKIERSAKSLFAQLPAGTQGAGSEPLCKQFPISTTLLRMVFLPSEEGEGAGAEAEAFNASRPAAQSARMVTAFDTETAETFLDFGFRGDFSGECQDEGGKWNLNGFTGLDPLQPAISGVNAYDRFKEMFVNFLSQERFQELFGDGDLTTIREAVRNIADWVDSNDQVNEMGRGQGGSEGALYGSAGLDYQVKNGKLATLDEAYLIAGVDDEWFTPLKRFFTVYGEPKINLCTAPAEIVEAVVTTYAKGNPRFPTFHPADTELMKKVTAAVTTACGTTQAQPQKVAQDIEAVLSGVAPVGTAIGAATPPPQPATPPATGSAGASSSLVSWITTTPRVYRLIGTGQVGEVVVRLTAVIDVKESDAKKWKMLYWRLD